MGSQMPISVREYGMPNVPFSEEIWEPFSEEIYGNRNIPFNGDITSFKRVVSIEV